MPQHLKFDAAACSSKPYEKASPELIEQLKKIAAFPRPLPQFQMQYSGMNILCRACMMTAPPIGVKNIPETPRRARKISSSNIAHDWRNEKCE